MPSSKYYTNMTCGLKVDTQSPGWYKTLAEVLRKINGVNYQIDAEEGLAYISGRVDANKILRKLANAGKHAELCWVETGNQKQNLYGNTFDDRYVQYSRLDPYWYMGHRPGYWPTQYYGPVTHYYPQRYPYNYEHLPYYPNPSWA